MKWYHYVAAFFAGVFLCNGVPHFVNGVSGNAFPSPFANPPGKGLSTAYINVVWGMMNFIIGYILLRVSKLSQGNKLGVAVFFVGITAMAIFVSIYFTRRMQY